MLGPGSCSPSVAREGFRRAPVCSQPGSLPAARLAPGSACRAEACRIACICKMRAREAGRRNFPLKHLIFKRNEARAGKQKQRAWLPCSCTLGSANQLPKPKPSESLHLPFEQTWYKRSRDLALWRNKGKNIIYSHSPGQNPPSPGAG